MESEVEKIASLEAPKAKKTSFFSKNDDEQQPTNQNEESSNIPLNYGFKDDAQSINIPGNQQPGQVENISNIGLYYASLEDENVRLTRDIKYLNEIYLQIATERDELSAQVQTLESERDSLTEGKKNLEGEVAEWSGKYYEKELEYIKAHAACVDCKGWNFMKEQKKGKRPKPGRPGMIQELKAQGMKNCDIAKKLEITEGTVRYWLKKRAGGS